MKALNPVVEKVVVRSKTLPTRGNSQLKTCRSNSLYHIQPLAESPTLDMGALFLLIFSAWISPFVLHIPGDKGVSLFSEMAFFFPLFSLCKQEHEGNENKCQLHMKKSSCFLAPTQIAGYKVNVCSCFSLIRLKLLVLITTAICSQFPGRKFHTKVVHLSSVLLFPQTLETGQ